jgi:hypothetical protein
MIDDTETRRKAAAHGGWIEATITRLLEERDMLKIAYRRCSEDLTRVGNASALFHGERQADRPLGGWKETEDKLAELFRQLGGLQDLYLAVYAELLDARAVVEAARIGDTLELERAIAAYDAAHGQRKGC